MRLLLRIIGTLLIAIAVILVIIDGTRTLAASRLVMTPLAETWMQLHPDSLEATREFLATRLFGPLLDTVATGILNFPGWAVIGIPGILIAWAGRSRRERVFLRQDQF